MGYRKEVDLYVSGILDIQENNVHLHRKVNTVNHNAMN